MAWVLIQKAEEMGWDVYEQVARVVGDDPPEGLIVHAAGERDGRWCSVDVWESQEAHDRFVEERLLPAVRQALGDEAADADPPPHEAFDVKHLIRQ